MPVKQGFCEWCGDRCKGRTYCSDFCRGKYTNLNLVHGKSLIQLLKIWRIHRGAKGTPGEGKLSDITFRLDQLLADDRQRRKEMTEARKLAAVANGVMAELLDKHEARKAAK